MIRFRDLFLVSDSNETDIEKTGITVGDNFFERAKKHLSKCSGKYIPVVGVTGDILCYCYDEKNTHYEAIEEAFEQFENEDEYLFMEHLYPQAKAVYLYDFNEYAYRLYSILRKRNIPCVIFSERWKSICQIDTDTNIKVPEYERFSIYAEGLQIIYKGAEDLEKTVNSFDFMIGIVNVNRKAKIKEIKDSFIAKGITFITCGYPSFDALNNISVQEYYRNKEYIDTHNKNLNFDDYLTKKNIIEAYEKPIDEVLKILDRDLSGHKEKIELSGHLFDYYEYGNAEKTVYLVGAACTSDYGVYKNESVGSYLFENLNGRFSVKAIETSRFSFVDCQRVFDSLDIKSKDIVIFFDELNSEDNDEIVSLKEVFEKRTDVMTYFTNIPLHTNASGNKAIASKLFEVIDTI